MILLTNIASILEIQMKLRAQVSHLFFLWPSGGCSFFHRAKGDCLFLFFDLLLLLLFFGHTAIPVLNYRCMRVFVCVCLCSKCVCICSLFLPFIYNSEVKTLHILGSGGCCFTTPCLSLPSCGHSEVRHVFLIILSALTSAVTSLFLNLWRIK